MTDQTEINKLTHLAITAAELAGREIMDVYQSPIAVEMKEDNSPLTEADQRANKVIEATLLDSGLPILSEEGSQVDFKERSGWDKYWLVDPLDGTKEFIKRNGEFTVNIALMEGNRPVSGVIYVPVTDTLYVGHAGLGSIKLEGLKTVLGNILTDDLLTPIAARGVKLPVPKGDRPVTLVGSRSHMSPETEAFMEDMRKKHGEVEVLAAGSSLKLCMVAEGKAEYYPRFAPTMEWDTAAGQAIVESMGGRVIRWPEQQPMTYNKEILRNDWFLVEGLTAHNS
ncbi:MAG: 3'(2'),5'-bisphosphate nucleotidase CysQ [Flavobacteriales bacterium]|nr:3'(2'),5'-bisphosphate nucleotidase CysQ [Flavobacteriales bacterium]